MRKLTSASINTLEIYTLSVDKAACVMVCVRNIHTEHNVPVHITLGTHEQQNLTKKLLTPKQ